MIVDCEFEMTQEETDISDFKILLTWKKSENKYQN